MIDIPATGVRAVAGDLRVDAAGWRLRAPRLAASGALKGTIAMTAQTATLQRSETIELPPPGTGSEGQTFLVGETVYLRGMELSDAKYARAWRAEPFPINAERAEEILKERIPKDRQAQKSSLLVVRRADDVPAGVATLSTWYGLYAELDVRPDPLLPARTRSALIAEVHALLTPYLLHERELMALQVSLPGNDGAAARGALAAGFAEVGRLREGLWRNGARQDQVWFEILHPGWVARLGDPRAGDAAFLETVAAQRAEFAARPSSARWIGSLPPERITGEIPRTAFAVGERIYIRPLEPEDADELTRWSRKETETFFDNGRGIASGINQAKNIRDLAEDDLPDELRFAVVLRDGDVFIGANGIEEISWIDRTAETESFFHRPDYRGNGYGTEAKHLLLEYAFERLGLHMVRSFVWQPNGRSAAALRKQGYRDAGIFHWDGFKDAAPANALMFDLLATEWRALRDAANG